MMALPSDTNGSTESIDLALWELLACPCPAHGEVVLDPDTGEILCTVCGLRFPIRDGIPVMLLDEARRG